MIMKAKTVFAGLLLLVIMIIFAFGIYYMKDDLGMKIGKSVGNKNAFQDYKVDTKFQDGSFRVEMRDLVTSTGSGKKEYYRYDIMVETADKSSAKRIKKLSPQVAAILNSVMSTFPPDKLSTEHQRNRVKQLMAEKITETYPEIKIKDLYFTNYVYN